MAPAVAERSRPKRPQKPKGPLPWWGDGEAPHVLWPGVSLVIPCEWSTLRRRWESDQGFYYFDAKEADRACDFFPEYLQHHIGEFAGRRFDLLDYQKKLLTRPLFGWKRAKDGLRRFRKVFAFIPKGGGKSPWASGTGLYLLFCDNEPAAEIAAVASDRQQARIVHDNAKIMVEQSPDLDEMSEILKDSIYVPATRSRYEVLSSEASSAHGKRPHGVIIDELHAQPNRDLYEALKKSLVKRRQPVLILISHAGDDDEGICMEEYEYAKGVLGEAKHDDTCLPVIFEASSGDDWTDPVVWRRVNPGHGITVQHDGIAAECVEAKNEPKKLNDFLRFHLNRWVNQATAWIPVDWWDACLESVPADAELQRYAVCAGLDLAQKFDLAALVLTFRVPIADIVTVEAIATETGGAATLKSLNLNYRIVLVPFFWIPEDTMREHELRDGLPYSDWQRAGLVTATEGRTIDYSRIYRDITETILPRFPRLRQGKIGYDPAFATDIATQLRDRAGLQVEEVLQNYTHLSEVSYVFEALVKAGRVAHGGHRVLRNHLQNVAIKSDDARRIRPVKPKQQSKRIDGVVGTLMGLKMLATVPDEPVEAFSFFMLGGGHGSKATS